MAIKIDADSIKLSGTWHGLSSTVAITVLLDGSPEQDSAIIESGIRLKMGQHYRRLTSAEITAINQAGKDQLSVADLMATDVTLESAKRKTLANAGQMSDEEFARFVASLQQARGEGTE
jgi:hypothetical protein